MYILVKESKLETVRKITYNGWVTAVA